MPRKNSKTVKPPLPFVERPVCGVRLQSGPEVRAAIHPKEYFTQEAQERSSSSTHLYSWVSPQFDTSVAAKRGRTRRKCHSVTSILDACSQLSRKSSMCKFPPLAFQSGSKGQHCTQQAKRTHTNNAAVSGGLQEMPKRAVRRRKSMKDVSADATCTSSSICAPPDVDTPKATREDDSSSSEHWILAQPCTPPRCQMPDVLVPDTPEQHYGLKVTWRRRTNLMSLLKDRGLLLDCDVLIGSQMI
ncbi:RAD9, HUS1, RAD1-interacting nuclear orphan protein 1 [Dunckerocampus dactyliophorus]|uniref:RAD9, HUS1, RAD1-interacting nuclear orphan protein 1 n=1 Tax=Dunckerocampus dactyliophorus TaxID=161453 RepID=UPI002404BB54|nr:RAD9, HUS1, RAD1-interacting nuclear orphan protein 1 [Dunckerocampus dactyliophorus]